MSTNRRRGSVAVRRTVALLAAAALPVWVASQAGAEPPPGPAVGPPEPIAAPPGPDVPPPDTGAVASSPPSVVTTPDGWVLTLEAANETQLPVAALTTAVSSRAYLAGGTFVGTVTGSGSTELKGGTLVVGYQIGCGVSLDKVTLGVQSSLSGFDLFPLPDSLDFNANIGGSIEVDLLPGDVQEIQVISKNFSGTATRVTLQGIHVSIDGCVGQSFLRSYATLTSSTAAADDIVSYYGPAKAV